MSSSSIFVYFKPLDQVVPVNDFLYNGLVPNSVLETSINFSSISANSITSALL